VIIFLKPNKIHLFDVTVVTIYIVPSPTCFGSFRTIPKAM